MLLLIEGEGNKARPKYLEASSTIFRERRERCKQESEIYPFVDFIMVKSFDSTSDYHYYIFREQSL